MSDQTQGAETQPTPQPTAPLLPGSERPPLTGATGTPVDPATPIAATLVLRRRAQPDAAAFDGPPLTQEELAQRYGADPADIERVRAALTKAGVTVVSADPATRLVRVSGPAGVLSSLFGTSLETGPDGGVATRHRSGPLTVPADLADAVTGVLGLDDRPQAKALFRIAQPHEQGSVSYTPVQIAELYQLPAGDGAGQTVAIIELGGGYKPADLDTYFASLNLATPKVTDVGVDGAVNGGGTDPKGADGEVLLDIEVVGAIAPKADIVVYFAPNTDAGFLDAVTQAAHATPTPAAISISWGAPEDAWTAQARAAMDGAFADAALLGVTVTAAAGDAGSGDGKPGVHVDFPAASPHALACGGTSLLASDGKITSEKVWNEGAKGGATGGGVSTAFPQPEWQRTAGVPPVAHSSAALAAGPTEPAPSTGPFQPREQAARPEAVEAVDHGHAHAGGQAQPAKRKHKPGKSHGGAGGRGVPDVAGNADPQTGWQVLIDGQKAVIGGTSAVSPLWAALVARIAQATGIRPGLLQPALYAGVEAGKSAPGFRDITEGDNGAYQAQPGWDACTGLGVPDGTTLLGLFKGHTAGA